MTEPSAPGRSKSRSAAAQAAAGPATQAPTLVERLTRKRVVLVVVLLGAALLLVVGTRVWVDGAVVDQVLGNRPVGGSGSALAPGVVAAALVAAAAAVAAATSGRVVRVLASAATVLAAVLAVVLVVGVLADPGAALGLSAANGAGPTGTIAASAAVTVWPWVALSAAVAMALGGLGALVGGVRWSGLSGRYDAPVASAAQVGAAGGGEVATQEVGRRRESTWERLSRGDDPTRDDPARDDPARDDPTRDDPARTG